MADAQDVFSEAAAASGAKGKPAGAGSSADAGADDDDDDDIGFLLGTQVRSTLAAAIALREAEYAADGQAGKPEPLERDREQLEEAVRAAEGRPAGSREANRVHALRLRVGERALLQNARDALGPFGGAEEAAAEQAAGGAKKRGAGAGGGAGGAGGKPPAAKRAKGGDGATAAAAAAGAAEEEEAPSSNKLAAFKAALGGKGGKGGKGKKKQKEPERVMTSKDDPVWSLFD